MPLAANDKAPDVTLQAEGGATVHLKDLMGKKTLVVYFYPKDDTPGCTVEACSFRDSYEDFVKAGADVIGISADKEDSHKDFKAKHNLPFRLMTDTDGSARKAFGVKATLGIIAGRVTFVIDTQGVVQHAFNSQLRAGKHVEEALAVVKRLASGPKAA